MRNRSIPVWNPHHDIHDLISIQENIPSADFVDPAKGILDNTHKRTVLLGRNDIQRDHAELADLRSGLFRLRNVKVHFVAIEIGVVRRGDGQIQSEGGVRHNTNTMSYKRH